MEFLGTVLPEAQIRYFYINFLDDFIWKGASETIDLKQLFTHSSAYHPESLTSSSVLSYSITIKRELESLGLAQETLNVQTTDLPGVSINHLVYVPVDTNISVKNASTVSKLINQMNEAHTFNKKMLQTLLTDKMQVRIGLIKPPKP